MERNAKALSALTKRPYCSALRAAAVNHGHSTPTDM